MMKEVGFSYVAFGVEAGNNKVLKALNKGEDIESIEKGIKDACEIGFRVHLFFLLGSPSETEEDVKDSVRLALRYPVEHVRFYNILPFPNTVLYNRLIEEGRFVRNPEFHLNDSSHWVFSPVFETPELSSKERVRLLRWANDVTKRHTDKVRDKRFIERMKAFRIPKFIARFMVKASKIEFLKKIFQYTGVLNRMKNLFINFNSVQ